MPADRSRRTDGLRDAYVGVVAQQGRVTLDRDFNAEHGYLAGRLEAQTIDVIGPSGTPGEGFKTSLPGTGTPTLCTPPEPLTLPSPEPEYDFLISPGTMYLGGQRAVLPGVQNSRAITYSFFDQPDRAHPPFGPDAVGPNNPPKQELVYLALSEQEVSAVEDPDLLEVALGGPDTTQRLRLMRRVSRRAVTTADCTSGWNQAVTQWQAADGLTLDPATLALRPAARLQVSFADEGATTDPCDPVAVNGYLGADNQTIRVQIASAGGPDTPGALTDASLLWGYDNASFIYRATPLASNPAMLTISPPPPDSFHIPQTNQVVEILRTAAVIASEPDLTDPTGQATIVRCVAERRGFIARLAQPYGPAGGGGPTAYIVLDRPLPAELLADTTPLFLRVWQSEIAFDPSGGTVLLTDDVKGISTGIQVTISTPKGVPITLGAFWEIAVRPSTPQAVYPERLLTAPQPPDGPALWACPLAVIDWTQAPPTVTDCRSTFTGLDGQGKGCGCCTVSVTPTGKLGIQQALDLAAKAGGGTVCLGGGSYALTAPLVFGVQHRGVTLEVCQTAVICVAAGSEAAFTQGLIQMANAPQVTLRGLDLRPALAPRPAAVTIQINGLLASAPALSAGALAITADSIEVMVAINVAESANVTIEDCIVAFANGKDATLSLFGVGVLAQGDCQGLTIEGCLFESFVATTYTRFATTTASPTTGVAIPTVPVVFQPVLATAATAAALLAASAAETRAVSARATRSRPSTNASAAATSTAVSEPIGTAPVATVPVAMGPVATTPVTAAPVGTSPVSTAPISTDPVSTLPPAPPHPSAMTTTNTTAPVITDPIVDLVHTGFTAIAVNTITTNETVAQNHLVAIVGVLAAPTMQSDSKSSLPCNLGQAVVRRNRFAGLTLGLFGVCSVDTLRLEDNDAKSCLGGYWLGLAGWRTPTDPKAQPLFQQWSAASGFTEFTLVSAVGFSFPPSPVRPRRGRRREIVDALQEINVVLPALVLRRCGCWRSGTSIVRYPGWRSRPACAVGLALHVGGADFAVGGTQ